MSSYYRYDEKGSITGAGTGPFRPSLKAGDTEVEVGDELADEMQAVGLAAYRQANGVLMRDKETIPVEKPTPPVTLEALAAKVAELEQAQEKR